MNSLRPPKPTPPPQFATEIPDRSPRFKHHAHIGMAKNAVAYPMGWNKARGGKIYRWSDDSQEWNLLHDIAPGTREEELPWRKK